MRATAFSLSASGKGRRFLSRVLALALCGLTAVLPAAFATDSDQQDRAIEWFGLNQAPDGALAGYENGYTPGGTADAVFALRAAGERPALFKGASNRTPIDYLKTHAGDDGPADDARDGADLAGKLAIAAAISRQDPLRFGGEDLVEFINDHYDPSSGAYRGAFTVNPLGQSLAMMGLLAAEEPVPSRAVQFLLSKQNPDGGWEFTGYGSDVSSTSMAVQALEAVVNASGTNSSVDDARGKALEFVRSQQNSDGGFSNQKIYAANYCSGERASEVDSTGIAIQAIRALGQDPKDASWLAAGSGPIGFLATTQNADGSFSYQEGPDCHGNGGSTFQAVLGLEEKSYGCLIGLGACPPRVRSNSPGSDDDDSSQDQVLERALQDQAATSAEIPERASPPVAAPAPPQVPKSKASPTANSSQAAASPIAEAPASEPSPVESVLARRDPASPPPREPLKASAAAGKKPTPPYFPVLGGLTLVGLLAGSITNQLTTGGGKPGLFRNKSS